MEEVAVCPTCSARYRIEGVNPGRRFRCGKCRSIFAIQETGSAVIVQGPAPAPSSPSTESARPSLPDDGKYQVLEEIARGGMGSVLRASDRDIGREVAMKVMLDALDEVGRARFVDEARMTGRLEHPNIVPVHDMGIDPEGRLFFTMKLVRGRSLQSVLEGLRKDLPEAKEYSLGRLLTVIVSVCNAMAFAHSRGVIHRDLKPANIMLGDFGEVLVMDWGLAKLVGQKSVSAVAETLKGSPLEVTAGKTLEGAILGTPHYMSPEQARGDLAAIDARSDIYSLGAILYETLTLRPPVEGTTLQAVLTNVTGGKIDPPERRAPDRDVPSELSAIALKALAKDPERRYPTVGELRKDIELFLEGRAVSAKEDAPWETVAKFVRRNKAVSTATGIAAAVVIALASTGYWLNLQERRKAELALAGAKAERARQAVDARNWDEARDNLDAAVAYDPDLSDARFLRAGVRLAKQDAAGALRDLQAYAAACPGDADALELLDLCRKRASNQVTLEAATRSFAAIYMRRKEFALASVHLKTVEERSKAYRALLSKALPVWDDEWLVLEPEGDLRLELIQRGIRDLSFLKGMILDGLDLDENPIKDLGPLRGMSIRRLSLIGCSELSDLSPLAGLPLESLTLHQCPVKDLSPLRSMPLKWLQIGFCPVSDLSPLTGLRIERLWLSNTHVADLTPLAGMPLRILSLDAAPIRDLKPLAGMPLENLSIDFTQVSDLSPLRQTRVTVLSMVRTPIRDLTPIEGLGLQDLRFDPRSITKGLDTIRSMTSLKELSTQETASLSPPEFWKRFDEKKLK